LKFTFVFVDEDIKMNKQERIIAVLLGLCLAGWLYYSVTEQKKAADAARTAAAQVSVRQSVPVVE
jgi:Ca2+/Na+ antiporter